VHLPDWLFAEAYPAQWSAGAAGADTLLQLIKNYARSHDIKRAVTVGVIGYPNVGKSSIINSLKRSKAVGVSATPARPHAHALALASTKHRDHSSRIWYVYRGIERSFV
jgi:ribosome biogenesis GTPase A